MPNAFGFQIEIVYTLIVVVLCFLVYLRTREIYSLSKHKGIEHFRKAFLFFGLAYAGRFLLHFLMLGRIIFDMHVSRRYGFPLSIWLVGFLSTMAILHLSYSMVWKRIKIRRFTLFSFLVSLLVSILAVVYQSPFMVLFLQLGLLIFALLMSLLHHKRFSNARLLYGLVLVFWLINLFVLGPRRLIGLEVKTFLQLASVVIFVLIYIKVSKWLR